MIKDNIDFIICGTQKGGTSALDAYLREHPEICMATCSEVHFFDDERIFKVTDPDYSVYHANFNLKPQHKIIGETTPVYMYWYDAPRRIWQYNPDIKLIVILRDPVERAFSHWNMIRSWGKEEMTFWDALIHEKSRCREALPYQHRLYSYIDRGYYLEQLRRLWTYFSQEQILILDNEKLRTRHDDVLKEVCDFLNVEFNPLKGVTAREVHSIPYVSKMTSKEREYLERVYEYDNQNLAHVLGREFCGWFTE